MEWRSVLGVVSGVGLVVGSLASIALVPWMRLFFGTLSVALAGVAVIGSLALWERPGSYWLLGAGLGFTLVGAVLLRWGRTTDDRPAPGTG